jgi:5,10-methylene-tetrahydrofolate dehydrogenase/methenyl tetrahydrofolate cyclohydrolase
MCAIQCHKSTTDLAASSWIAVTETLSPAKSRATIAMLMKNTLQAARQQSGGV